MAEQTKPQTPIKDAKAGIGGLRLTPGTDKSLPRIEVRLSFPLDRDTSEWVAYLSRCMILGTVYVDLRSPQPMLDETPLEEADPQDGAPAKPSDLFPGWPIACGKPVRIEGANAVCDAGHVTTTPFGEPCNHMEPQPASNRCAITWAEDAADRCELEEGHAGAHHFPSRRVNGEAGTEDPDELRF